MQIRLAGGRLVAVAALAAVCGCVKLDNRLTVMPDGSGKFVLQMGYNEENLRSLRAGGALTGMDLSNLDLSSIDPRAVEKQSAGFVAFARPRERTSGTWRFVEVTGYFEDLNKVRIWEEGTRREQLSFAFRKTAAGYDLTARNLSVADAGGSRLATMIRTHTQLPDAARQFMAPMLAGLHLSEAYKLPGVVATIQGLDMKSGRVAGTIITEAMAGDAEKVAYYQNLTTRRIICGPSTVSASELKAFKDELTRAKADWAKITAGNAQR